MEKPCPTEMLLAQMEALLRRLMGEGWIETVYGVGYRLYNKVGKQRDISEKP